MTGIHERGFDDDKVEMGRRERAPRPEDAKTTQLLYVNTCEYKVACYYSNWTSLQQTWRKLCPNTISTSSPQVRRGQMLLLS